ncbi:MAG: cardiolipin synthase [Oscillospiraceae bacterium]|nr:cardiolipin synthase [Oscillospiraceae bacterium]
MRKILRFRYDGRAELEKEINYIPLRYILAIALAALETVLIIAAVIWLSYHLPYFYLVVALGGILCIIRIIGSDDNPDYKVPWLVIVLLLPVVGFMLYVLFYDRRLKKRFIKRLVTLWDRSYKKDDTAGLANLTEESPLVATQATMLGRMADAHVFTNTSQRYFPLGDDMHGPLLEDLRSAEKFIFMEYFIIEEGCFWNSVLEILKEKASAGVEVKVVYDDIGCMMTLPGNYHKVLGRWGIEAVPFSKLKGNADSEFNNRSHRKIAVIDGKIGYTGGINLADEYINRVERHGHWKDVGIRLEGEAVKELTRLFLIDYGINVKRLPERRHDYFPNHSVPAEGYVIPFGDGPSPIYRHRVGKSVIQNLLNHAVEYVWIMSPYLVIDNELCQTIENAALRGVQVRLILPHIPDKKLIFEMAKGHYKRLMEAGVEIYEYAPGFVHAKCYLADGNLGMVGSINLDYRSLVHHFENGVWMYRCECLEDIRMDFEATLEKCIRVDESQIQWPLWKRLLRAVLKVFAPMM